MDSPYPRQPHVHSVNGLPAPKPYSETAPVYNFTEKTVTILDEILKQQNETDIALTRSLSVFFGYEDPVTVEAAKDTDNIADSIIDKLEQVKVRSLILHKLAIEIRDRLVG